MIQLTLIRTSGVARAGSGAICARGYMCDATRCNRIGHPTSMPRLITFGAGSGRVRVG